MSEKALLPSRTQFSFSMKRPVEDSDESDNESVCVSSYFDDKDDFHESSNGLPINVYLKWRKAALLICGLSIGFEFVLGIISLVLSIIYRSPGTFGMAIDSVVDIATTMVVIWRFSGSDGTKNSYIREQRANYGISLLFILSSFAVLSKAIFDLIRANKPYFPYILCSAASVSFAAYTGLAWAKYVVAQKLQSRVMYSDAINTFCVDLMAGMVLISLLVYKYTSTWYIGSIVAILISLFLFFYGVRNIARQSSSKEAALQWK